MTGAPPEVTTISISGTGLTVRTVAALAVPARLLGRESLAAGDTVRIAATLTTHARAYRMEWRGGDELTLLGE